MFVAYSFVGILPPYIVEAIHQTRTYFSGDIYLILSDIQSPYIEKLLPYHVHLVDYNDVKDTSFLECVEMNKHRFLIVNGLTGREELFIRSFERFYLLKHLMESKNLQDCLFLELDNLIYDDPNHWLSNFSKKELAYMYDSETNYSSGIMYVKNHSSLDGFLQFCIEYISTTTDFLSEMCALCRYYKLQPDKIQILPTHWNECIASQEYESYHSLFDSAPIGIFLLGMDPYHSNGVIEKVKSKWSRIDYSQLQFEWREDEKGKRPYVFNGEIFLLINNLHVHSKDLKSGLSRAIPS
jgi:hypothetical protein